jgi:hypothetical protein
MIDLFVIMLFIGFDFIILKLILLSILSVGGIDD